MEYNFKDIERDARKKWAKENVYKVTNDTSKPKCYVLDMFPYPSGAGLHVGHPLGYIASDIYARYKRLCGYNVLHPMGFDAFGLPAEQYAIETGQHPADTTKKNIERYKEQLNKIGFCYEWDRVVTTSDPKYYKWTQWIFLQLFHSWYDRAQQKARPISELVAIFEKEGGFDPSKENGYSFTKIEWKDFDEKEKRNILMQYRLAYQDFAQVWWCEALGTVLANDEVVNGVSERGGHPVERKNMRQWFLRITEYAERLLTSLDSLDWSEAMKEMQRNWIGKSVGSSVSFKLVFDWAKYPKLKNLSVLVFTTRPDTIFGVDFLVLAPEHDFVGFITSDEQKEAIENYRSYVKSRSERERMSEVKQVTGCFTGAYAIHPLTGKHIPVWISEYVLINYGYGAIMAVPSGDERDHAFAKHFHLSITNIFGEKYNGEEAYSDKIGTIENSDFLTGLNIAAANAAAMKKIEELNIGVPKVNYRLRDAGFSRQRYWGEPFPIVYVGDVPYATDEIKDKQINKLPVELPMVQHYKPGPEGEGPLANIKEWVNTPEGKRETNTMPGYAGSSWYFLRYMDPHNDTEFAGRAATDYWQQVDLYIGGTEHAVGHLLYSRMWTKALYDLGHIGFDEPFKKLLNQGMIQGVSKFIWNVGLYGAEIIGAPTSIFKICISYDLYREYQKTIFDSDILKMIEQSTPGLMLKPMEGYDKVYFKFYPTRVNIDFVDDEDYLDVNQYHKWNHDILHVVFLTKDTKIRCSSEVEKMSKSKYNVVNPDKVVEKYGADTFRMYEMFLGPIDVSKPWDTKGIEGVHRFLKKLWRLYADEQKGWIVTDEQPAEAELRILHKTIKKIHEDIERFSFNTAVSQFMICVNELSGLNCHKRGILEPLAVIICPFAPHIAEELWQQFGHKDSVTNAIFPKYLEMYVTDNSKMYPVAINGKTRMEMEFPLDAEPQAIEKEVLANEAIQKWLEGKTPKKFIYVRGKMINVVV